MNKLVLKIPGETNFLSKIREFALSFAEKMGFDEGALGDIEMAVDEWATNIIRHSYGEDPEFPSEKRIIEVEVNKLENGIEIVFQDRGKPYNPKNTPLPDLRKHVEERKTHGLGVFAMKQFMDELDYQYVSGVGNRIVLRKFLKRNY
jgi:anti-sigma regulatory factor (Ser/Thr protein kinase)